MKSVAHNFKRIVILDDLYPSIQNILKGIAAPKLQQKPKIR
jgi:hypothetical protein